ncbi:CBO0543 family protein [Niallia sp. Krafla_26]|uniref:CBO0543 family protein n=1 Tax=Niallia sp. Krafla_26 TaxID=3064703 RepID=UPI003D16C98A
MIEWTAIGIFVLLLFNFVPRKRFREENIIFLFKQLITFLFGLLAVERKFLEYPSRVFFRRTLRSSFTFEYFIYPTICTLFNLYYPEKRGYFVKFLYYFVHTAPIAAFEVFAKKYTNIIRYKNGWTWYWSFITLWISNYISRIYHQWFIKAMTVDSIK